MESNVANEAFKEKSAYPYIYVDSLNKVHVLMPLSAGDEITLDTTCGAMDELKCFFDFEYKPRSGGASALQSVDKYINDLTSDLLNLKNTDPGYADKNSRLIQLQRYQKILQEINTEDVKAAFEGEGDDHRFPKPIYDALNDDSANCVAMRLCPSPHLDHSVKFHNPRFSLSRDNDKGLLALKLKESALQLPSASFRKQIVEEICAKYPKDYGGFVKNDEQLDALKNCIKAVLSEHGYLNSEAIEFIVLYKGNEYREVKMDYLTGVHGVGDIPVAEVFSYLYEGTQATCDKPLNLKNHFQLISNGNPFEMAAIKEMPLLIQFFLGVAALYYGEQTGKTVNLGALLEQNQQNIDDFVNAIIKGSCKNGDQLETLILTQFATIVLRSSNDVSDISECFEKGEKTIRERFHAHWNSVNSGITEFVNPKFDEFLQLLTNKKGGHFYNHQHRISLHTSEYVRHFSNKLYALYFVGENAPLASRITVRENEHSVKLSASNLLGYYPSSGNTIHITRDMQQSLYACFSQLKAANDIIINSYGWVSGWGRMPTRVSTALPFIITEIFKERRIDQKKELIATKTTNATYRVELENQEQVKFVQEICEDYKTQLYISIEMAACFYRKLSRDDKEEKSKVWDERSVLQTLVLTSRCKFPSTMRALFPDLTIFTRYRNTIDRGNAPNDKTVKSEDVITLEFNGVNAFDLYHGGRGYHGYQITSSNPDNLYRIRDYYESAITHHLSAYEAGKLLQVFVERDKGRVGGPVSLTLETLETALLSLMEKPCNWIKSVAGGYQISCEADAWAELIRHKQGVKEVDPNVVDLGRAAISTEIVEKFFSAIDAVKIEDAKRLLSENPALLNQENAKDGSTPLIYAMTVAAANKDNDDDISALSDFCLCLIANPGIALTHANSAGNTALHLSVLYGNEANAGSKRREQFDKVSIAILESARQTGIKRIWEVSKETWKVSNKEGKDVRSYDTDHRVRDLSKKHAFWALLSQTHFHDFNFAINYLLLDNDGKLPLTTIRQILDAVHPDTKKVPLQSAIEMGDESAIASLMHNGANQTVKTKDGDQSLVELAITLSAEQTDDATRQKFNRGFSKLFEELNARQCDMLLVLCIKKYKLACVRELLKHKERSKYKKYIEPEIIKGFIASCAKQDAQKETLQDAKKKETFEQIQYAIFVFIPGELRSDCLKICVEKGYLWGVQKLVEIAGLYDSSLIGFAIRLCEQHKDDEKKDTFEQIKLALFYAYIKSQEASWLFSYLEKQIKLEKQIELEKKIEPEEQTKENKPSLCALYQTNLEQLRKLYDEKLEKEKAEKEKLEKEKAEKEKAEKERLEKEKAEKEKVEKEKLEKEKAEKEKVEKEKLEKEKAEKEKVEKEKFEKERLEKEKAEKEKFEKERLEKEKAEKEKLEKEKVEKEKAEKEKAEKEKLELELEQIKQLELEELDLTIKEPEQTKSQGCKDRINALKIPEGLAVSEETKKDLEEKLCALRAALCAEMDAEGSSHSEVEEAVDLIQALIQKAICPFTKNGEINRDTLKKVIEGYDEALLSLSLNQQVGVLISAFLGAVLGMAVGCLTGYTGEVSLCALAGITGAVAGLSTFGIFKNSGAKLEASNFLSTAIAIAIEPPSTQ